MVQRLVPSLTFVRWVSTLRARLRVCRALWLRYSSLRAPARSVVVPCQTIRQTHTRARSTAVSRFNP